MLTIPCPVWKILSAKALREESVLLFYPCLASGIQLTGHSL